jgi:hypothetical protein
VVRPARTRAQGSAAREHRHPQPLQQQVRRGLGLAGPVMLGQLQQRPGDAAEITGLAEHRQRAVEKLACGVQPA